VRKRKLNTIETDSKLLKFLGASLVLVVAISVIGYLGGFFARASTFQMATGSYTGNGTSQSITELGFSPDFVIVKASDDAQYGVWTSSAMSADTTVYFRLYGTASITGAITSLDGDGFSVGSHATVNSNGITYYWEAFGGSGSSYFKVGSYTGDGNDNRQITEVGFQPDFVLVRTATYGNAYSVWSSSALTPGGYSYKFYRTMGSNMIQGFHSDGFEIGTNDSVNRLDETYYYVAFKQHSDAFNVGSYTGDGNDNRQITEVGFQPQYVWIEGNGTDWNAVHKSDQISGEPTQYFQNANDYAVGMIKTLDSDGFTLGTNKNVNYNLGTYFYVAWANAATVPVLDSLDPTSGEEGDEITLSGSNFGDTQGSSTVSFNGTAATTYTFWSNTSVVVEVPVGATTGNVTLTTNAGTSNGVNFSVYPKITDLSPSSGNSGDTVTITGLNFEASRGSNTVTFNGVEAASYTSWSDTEIVVVAPSSTTGDVVVTTSVGASTGSTFSYYPAISSISPTSGSRSISVTITGSNFGSSRGSSYVSFGSAQASASNYLVWGDDSILVQVPSDASKGDNSVVVTTSVGASNSQTFKLVTGTKADGTILVPSITSVSPASLDISEIANTSFTITGANFDKENGVKVQFYLTGVGWFESKQESATSTTTIKVKFVDATKAAVGDYYVVVTNIKGGNKDSLEKAFTISDKTAVVVEVPEGEEEVVEEPAAPSTVDSAAITLLTGQLNLLKKQYDQVIDLLKFFGRLFSGPSRDDVLESTYQYEIDFQSPNPSLTVGETGSVTVSVKNTGTATWYKDGVYPINLGTSSPLDRASVFATDSWFGDNNRPAKLQEESVAPNSLGTFVISLKAPSTPGEYTEPFRLVAEGFSWLSGPEISWTILVR